MFRVVPRRQTNKFRATVATYTPPTNDDFLLKRLEGPLETLSPGAVPHPSRTAQLRNVKVVASYSWVKGPIPSIAVPGYPRIWRKTTVTTVPADSSVHYVDRNASFMGHRSPLIPIFAAVDSLHNDFQYRDLDLMTDRKNLRKLLRCINQQRGKTFLIDVDLIGKTCLLTRREETLVETIEEFCGYGHEYELAATKPHRGFEDEISHHRIINYEFGGLKILLRYEVDACTKPESEDGSFLASSSVPRSIGTSAYSSRFGMKIKMTSPRFVVPQSRIIEIKTRAVHKGLDWKEVYPQLYLSQTPYLYLAKHTRGTFGRVEKIQINSQGMAARARATMTKFQELLRYILKAIRKHGQGVPLCLVYRAGKLQLYRRRKRTRQPFGKDTLRKFQHAATI